MLRFVRLYASWLLLVAASLAQGQSLLFSNLNTSDGLSDNNARSITIDKNGFLWIGTSRGLNVYDGYNIVSFFKERHPEMPSNVILHLITDSHNRIWIGTPSGAAWLDENRRFHRVSVSDTIQTFVCSSIFETKSYGVILFSDKGQYYFDSTAGKWTRIDWIPEPVANGHFLDAEPYSEDSIIFVNDSLVSILDYHSRKIVYKQAFDMPVSACPASAGEIAVGLHKGRVAVASVANKGQSYFDLTTRANGKILNTYLTEVRRACNGDLLIATDFAGLITIDQAGNITRHTHDPISPRSISANNTYRSFAGQNGEIIVGTFTSGVSVANIYNKPAGYTRIFRDGNGNLFDNYITNIAQESNSVFWLGAYDRLIRWNRETNESSFYYYYQKSPEGTHNMEIRALCIDHIGNLWVSVPGDGLSVFDRKKNVFKKVMDTGPTQISHLLSASDGNVWMASGDGVQVMDPVSTSLVNTYAALEKLHGMRANVLYEDWQQRIWIGMSTGGAYCFDRKRETMQHYGRENGLPSNTIYGFADGPAGTMYIATASGFAIFTGDSITSMYTRENGLRYERCEGLLPDNNGNIWIANTRCLAKFNPVRKTFAYFEASADLSISGFRPGALLKASNGELLWGSQTGLNYFSPSQLISGASPLRVSLSGIDIRDSVWSISNNASLNLPYSRNEVTFYFTAIDLHGSRDIAYQYKLDAYDKEWHTATDVREAHYSSLPAGTYTFLVKASVDRSNWTMARNRISVHITPPVWQRWWFIGVLASLITGTAYWYMKKREHTIRMQAEQLETEQAINYFASSMYDQQRIDNILWDVVKNCIGRLKFEDCVIYVVDESRNVLVQKAAHGPKSPRSYEISQPIEIPVGKGIVGSVAASGIAEIIPDTSADERYIVDDQRRYSEIAVPMVSDGRVLGVIDCEHSHKRFFTQRHLSILTTIASLCANKIVRAKAEEEKEAARVTLMETQQKMGEAEMQALRAQMNPHFIFNCLNSINRYIVRSDQATASLYLTKFAKLIRLILDNSNSKNVMLSNELEALKLYIDMEALRFDRKFSYEICVDPGVCADTIEVPPLIIQPYVENAIWHGLLHKPTVGHLRIHISLPGDNMLQCVIEDNGVGRMRAKEIRSKSATTKRSLGLKLTESRLALLNKHAELNASVEIIDLENENEASGTRVILKIPL